VSEAANATSTRATPPGIRPHGPYWASLDGVRGIAMLIVFAYHVYPPWVPGASIAVDSFFVLSAFLITFLLVREHTSTGRIRLGRFYARRLLRLLPVLVVVAPLAGLVAWKQLPALRPDIWPSLRSTLLYYANFRAAAHPQHMAIYLPTWSLSTEEQFYAVWPPLLVLLMALGLRARGLVVVTGSLLVASVVWLQVAADHGTAPSALYYRPDLRVTGILVGTVVGLLYSYGLLPDRRWLRPVSSVAAAAGVAYIVAFLLHPLFVPARFLATLAIATACVGWAAVILTQVTAPLRPLSLLLANRPMRWVGRASYTIYLVHVPVVRVTRSLMGSPGPVPLLCVAGAATLAVTAVVHYLIERPALRLKDRRAEPADGGEQPPRLRPWSMTGRRSTSS